MDLSLFLGLVPTCTLKLAHGSGRELTRALTKRQPPKQSQHYHCNNALGMAACIFLGSGNLKLQIEHGGP